MKILLKVVAALVLMAVLAVGALLLFFDPNAYKEELVGLARDKGAVALIIDGDIGWSLFPNLALALPGLTVDDLEGQRIAAVAGADVSVAVMPLLSGRLEMSGVSLRGLVLDLEAPAADGEEVGAAKSGAPAKSEKTPAGPVAEPGHAPELDIDRIEIRGANIRYRMPATGQTLELSNFDFNGERVVSGRAFPASSAFRLVVLNADQQPELSVDAELSAQLLLDLAAQKYAAQELDLKLNLGGAAFNGQSLPLFIGGDLSAEPGLDRAAVDKLKLDLAGMQLRGQLDVSQMSTAPVISGALEAAPFDLNQLLRALGQPVVETSDAKALSRVGFKAEIGGPANTVGLKPLTVQLDDTRFTGELGFDLVSGRQRVVLQGDNLNLDRYLPPATDAPETTGPGAGAAGTSTVGGSNGGTADSRYSKAPLLPVEALRALNFDLRLGLNQLIASGLNITELTLQATARDGVVRAEEIAGALYGGRFDNSAVLDASQAPLRADVTKKISSVQLGGLLNDLTQQDRVSGTLSLEGRYRTRGNSIHAMVNSLNGNSVISLKDGRLKGVNLIDTLCQGIRKVKGMPASEGTTPDYTDFSNLSATLKITDGVVDSRDLAASMVAVGLAGAGQVDLPAANLDYGLDLKVLQQLQGESCQIEEKLHNLAFPVRCKGGFDDDPGKLCRPDTARMKKMIGKLARREASDKLEKKLEEKLKGSEEVKGLLKGLFK